MSDEMRSRKNNTDFVDDASDLQYKNKKMIFF